MNRPGEYIGKDGRTYRWKPGREEWHIERWGDAIRLGDTTPKWHSSRLKLDDWPAAKDALDALIESEQEEWVEISLGMLNQCYYRLMVGPPSDPRKVLEKRGFKGWERSEHDFDSYLFKHMIEIAYHKGREVALQDVQELAEAIDQMGCISGTGQPGWPNQILVDEGTHFRVRDLAKKVKL